MADKQLRFLLSAQDNASKTISSVADKGEASGKRLSSAFLKAGQVISGEFGEVLNKVGEGMDELGEKGKNLSSSLMVAGGAAAGVGVLLTSIGASEKQATDQLNQAITDTGASVSDYSEDIEEAVKHGENYARSAVDTKNALATLTQATQSPEKALEDYNVVLDLAAAKHESLSDAAKQVALVYGGNTRVLKQYGIDMTVTAGNTGEADDAINALSQRISGQADASMDNFGSKVDAVKTKLGDWAGEIGQKAGPAITVLGTALAGSGAAFQIWQGHVARAAAAQKLVTDAETAATTETGLASKAISTGSSVLSRFGPAGAAAAVGIGLLTVALKQHEQGAINAASADKAFQESLDEDNGSIGDSTEKQAALLLSQAGAFKAADTLGISYHTLTEAALQNSDAMDQVGTATDAARKFLQDYGNEQNPSMADTQKADAISQALGVTLNALGGTYNSLKTQIAQNNDVSKALNVTQSTALTTYGSVQAAIASTTTTIGGVVVQLRSGVTQADLFTNALNRLTGSNQDVEQSDIEFRQSIDALSQSFKQNGTSLDINTAKGQANMSAVISASKAADAHAEAVYKQTGSVDKATAAMASDEAAFRASALAAGLTATQVDVLTKKYFGVPADITTTLKANTLPLTSGVAAAFQNIPGTKVISVIATAPNIYTVKRQIEDAYGQPIYQDVIINTKTGTSHLDVPHNASGTTFSPGGTTLVGEDGPELVDLPTGSQVRTASATERIRTNSGGNTYITNHITVKVPVSSSPHDVGRAVAGVLEEWVGMGGQVKIASGIT